MTPNPSAVDDRLHFALAIAEKASHLILEHYGSTSLQVDFKSDDSPVTIADRGAETLMRHEIESTFPDDAILGEEHGEKTATGGFRWILDPIDGTKAFVHGAGQFGTLIGLEHAGKVVAGVCRFPALNEVIYARHGGGAWRLCCGQEPEPCHVSETTRLEEALFCFTEIRHWYEIGRENTFNRLCRSVRVARGWGDCFGHMLVATGRADVMVDPELNPWDAAALQPIVEEAGGHYTDWNGIATIYGGQGVSVNSKLKAVVLDCLKPEQ